MDMSHDLTLSGWATDGNDPDGFFRPLLSCAAIHSRPTSPTGAIRNSTACCVRRSPRSSWQRVLKPYDEAQSILAQELPILPLASSFAFAGLSILISKVWYSARLVTPPLLGCIARNGMR